MKAGHGDRLQRLVVGTGYECWLWRRVTKAGCGDWLMRQGTKAGLVTRQVLQDVMHI